MFSTEPFYQYLAAYIGYNYILFRTIVWGAALFFFFQTAKRFGLDPYKTSFLMYSMFITIFDYARATLGMSIFFYGLSFLCIPLNRGKIFSPMVGGLFILSSILFHNSMALLIAMTFLAFIPLNKKILFLLIIVVIPLIPRLGDIFGLILNVFWGRSGGDLTDKVAVYSEQVADLEGASVFELFRRYVEYTTFVAPFVIITPIVLSNKQKTFQSTGIKRLYKVTFGILILALFLLFVTDTVILFNRTLFMTMIPIVIIWEYARQNKLISYFMFKSIVCLCLLQVFFNYSKRILGGNLS